MASDSQQFERRRTAAGIGGFLLLWFVASVVTAGFVSQGWGYWIELLNGATWPQAVGTTSDAQVPRGNAFFVLVGLRTVINLGAVLTALFAVYWLSTGGVERWLMNKVETVSASARVALATKLIGIMESRGLEVPEKLAEELMTAARDFDRTELGMHFLKRQNDAAAQAQAR